MASGAHQTGLAHTQDGTNPFLTTTWKALLLATSPAYTYDPDTKLVDAGGANDIADAELATVAGYTRGWGGSGRKTLASKTISVNDANNRVEWDCADITWTALGAGQTIEAVSIVKEGGANDTTSEPLAYLDPSNVAPNGGDVTLQIASNGFLNFNC